MVRLKIQSKLIEVVKAGPYYQVNYNVDATPISFDIGDVGHPAIEPSSVRSNEIGSLFSQDPLHGSSLSLSRTEWNFLVRITFNVEVTLEAFEESMMKNPPIIPADGVKGYRQVTLLLDRISAIHPVQQQAPNGTEATIAFKARIGRL